MIFKTVFEHISRMRNPVKYWRKRGARIGENCYIVSSVSFGSEPFLVTVGDHVRLTSDVQLITHDGGVWVLRELYPELKDIDVFGRIKLGNNIHIGVSTIIMPGVTIGDNSIIGAGAVVTKDIPANSIAVGVPARVIKTLDEYIDKNEHRFEHTKGMSLEEKRAYLIKKYGTDA